MFLSDFAADELGSQYGSDDGRFLPLKFAVDTRKGAIEGALVDFRQGDTNTCITVSR